MRSTNKMRVKRESSYGTKYERDVKKRHSGTLVWILKQRIKQSNCKKAAWQRWET